MIKVIIPFVFIAGAFLAFYVSKNISPSLVLHKMDKEDVLSFEIKDGRIYFQTKAETAHFPSILEIKKSEDNTALISIQKRAIHSPVDLSDSELKSSDSFVQLRVQYEKENSRFYVDIPDHFLNLKLTLD